MISEKIKELRNLKGITQKELVEKLFVTPQAVSRWENGEVEPSLTTVVTIAKIFEVSTDEILGITEKAPPAVVVEKEYVVKENTKPVLAVCEKCNRPIYLSDEIVRTKPRGVDGVTHVFCSACDKKEKEEKRKKHVKKAKKRRILSFILGGVFLCLSVVLGIIFGKETLNIVYSIIIGIAGFTLISCCLFYNNFIGEVMETIWDWGFVRMPGLIFSLDLEEIIWLLTVKLLFWIIEFIIALAVGFWRLSWEELCRFLFILMPW